MDTPTPTISLIIGEGAIGNLGQAIIVVNNPDCAAITVGVVVAEQTIGNDILHRPIISQCPTVCGPIIAEFTPVYGHCAAVLTPQQH